MALDVDWTPNGIIESNTCPDVLRCEGFYQGEDLTMCQESVKDWKTVSKYDEIYEALSKFKPTTQYSDNEEMIKNKIEQYGDPEIYANNNRIMYWEAAVELSFCDDTSVTCREALLSPSCRDDASCDLVRSACDSKCRVSYYLLTKWFPLFPNFKNNNSPKCSSGKQRQSIFGQDKTIDVEGTKQPTLDDCFKMWQNIANSAKARYFIQYLDRFGPYVVVCFCFRKCFSIAKSPSKYYLSLQITFDNFCCC